MDKKAAALFLSVLTGTGIVAGTYQAYQSKKHKAEITGKHVPYGPYEAVIKRPLDCILASAALAVLSPVMAITGLLVRVKLGSPVLFIQDRPGRDEKIFKLYKFRSMTDAKNGKGELLPDKDRLTGFGKTLRELSIDELPELFNIICGDMAVVGPRPLLVEYLPYYTEQEKLRHSVRPGLTGLSQVNGRNNLEWDHRMEMDVRYAKHITFMGDLRIILLTVKKILQKSDVSSTFEEGNFAQVRRQKGQADE